MYRGRPWTMRQYAGFATAAESNRALPLPARRRASAGLSVAFDLPTQIGYDSDHPLAAGEVGRVGVAIDSIEDMDDAVRRHPARSRVDVDDHQRDGDHPARAVRRGRAAPGRRARRRCPGTLQNDILKEYVARGTYIYPPRPSLRIVTDIIAFCEREMPQWNTISISGYHIREAGSTAVQEVAFTLAHAHRLRAGGASTPGSTSTRSASGCRSSSTPTTTSSRRSRSSARRGGCGRASCATGSAPPTRARSSCASTRRPPAARSPPSSPTTTSSASRCRRWPRCSAARSRCTATAATRRWRCRPRRARRSRCARSRSSLHESGVANTVDPVGGLVRHRGR